MSISKRQFFLSLAGLFVTLLGLNQTIVYLTRNSLPRRYMEHIRQSRGATVIAIGNSLIEQGVDKPAFDRVMGLDRERGILNLGMASSSPVEHLLFLRYALHQQVHPRVVIYGFLQTQLTSTVSLSISDLVGNQSMLFYLEPDFARGYYNLSKHDAIEFAIMRHIRMIVERGAIWGKVERFRRSISRVGLPIEAANRFGRVSDFLTLRAIDADDFVRQCDLGSSQDLSPPMSEFIRSASEAHAKVIVIEMPLHPEHLRLFYDTPAWQRYRNHLRNILGVRGVTYIDASHWFPETAFQDHIHLTDEGAARFSEQLGKSLAAVGP